MTVPAVCFSSQTDWPSHPGSQFEILTLGRGKAPLRDPATSKPPALPEDIYSPRHGRPLIIAGDFNANAAAVPKVREVISTQTILDAHFGFKEQSFYTVTIDD